MKGTVRIRGIRSPIPKGYLIGRSETAQGDSHPIKVGDNLTLRHGKLDAITQASQAGGMRWYGGLPGIPGLNTEGVAGVGQTLFDLEMIGDEIFDIGFPLNKGGCEIAPTGNITCAIRKSGVTVGSMNIASGSLVATWTLAALLTFPPAGRFQFYAPFPVDPTLSGLGYTFVGRRA